MLECVSEMCSYIPLYSYSNCMQSHYSIKMYNVQCFKLRMYFQYLYLRFISFIPLVTTRLRCKTNQWLPHARIKSLQINQPAQTKTRSGRTADPEFIYTPSVLMDCARAAMLLVSSSSLASIRTSRYRETTTGKPKLAIWAHRPCSISYHLALSRPVPAR